MRDYKLRKRVYNNFVDGEKLEKKTSAMTTPVGVDEEGKLWTSGGGGGGSTKCYKIEFKFGRAYGVGEFNLIFKPIVDTEIYVVPNTFEGVIESGATTTFRWSWSEDDEPTPWYSDKEVCNFFVYASEYEIADYSAQYPNEDPYTKFLTITEVTL